MDGQLYYSVTLDSTSPAYYGWKLASIPTIQRPTRNRDRYSIPGRDGELLGTDKWNSNAFITCVFHTRVHTRGFESLSTDIWDRMLDLKNFLDSGKKLRLSARDDYEDLRPSVTLGYYEILQYNIVSEQRKANDYLRVEVQFEVYPYNFIDSGDDIRTVTHAGIASAYDDSKPIYHVYAARSGTATITVNDKNFVVDTTDDLMIYIDTRRQIAYTNSPNQPHTKVKVTGDYADLWMKHGENTFEIDNGILQVETKWGYSL